MISNLLQQNLEDLWCHHILQEQLTCTSWKFLVTYDTNKLLRTSSKVIEKISNFLSRFALGRLLGPLGPACHPLPLEILEGYSLDIVVTKRIAYLPFTNWFMQVSIFRGLGPNRLRTHLLVTSSPSNIPSFRAWEVNRWVKSYLPDGLIFPVMVFLSYGP